MILSRKPRKSHDFHTDHRKQKRKQNSHISQKSNRNENDANVLEEKKKKQKFQEHYFYSHLVIFFYTSAIDFLSIKVPKTRPENRYKERSKGWIKSVAGRGIGGLINRGRYVALFIRRNTVGNRLGYTLRFLCISRPTIMFAG